MVEIKRYKLNTLSQKYELFWMQPYESILDLKKRFSHLTNHLMALDKTFTNDELNLKFLRSLTKNSEKKSLSKTSSTSLFGKLQEHEIELEKLERREDERKNSKRHALKTRVKKYDSSKEDESTNDEDDDLIKRFKKFLRKERKKEII